MVDGERDVGGVDGDVRQRRLYGDARVDGDGGAQGEERSGERGRARRQQLIAHAYRWRRHHRC